MKIPVCIWVGILTAYLLRRQKGRANLTITPFGGISFVNDAFTRSGLSALTDKEPGRRTVTGYQYSDILRMWFSLFFCRDDVAEDVQTHLRAAPKGIPSNLVPNADTLLRGLKELSMSNTSIVSSSGKRIILTLVSSNSKCN